MSIFVDQSESEGFQDRLDEVNYLKTSMDHAVQIAKANNGRVIKGPHHVFVADKLEETGISGSIHIEHICFPGVVSELKGDRTLTKALSVDIKTLYAKGKDAKTVFKELETKSGLKVGFRLVPASAGFTGGHDSAFFALIKPSFDGTQKPVASIEVKAAIPSRP